MADPSYIVDGVLTDGEAWVALFSTTLTSDAANIAFTSTNDGQVGDFSQYMDLVVIAYVRGAAANNDRYAELNINGVSTDALYDTQQLYGDGSSVTAVVSAENRWFRQMIADAATANAFSVAITTFYDVNSGKFKSWLVQSAGDRDGAGTVALTAGTYKSQAPISSLEFYPDSGDFLDESRIDLFGVLPRMVA